MDDYINYSKLKTGGRWCVLVPPGALGPDGSVSVETFGIRTRSKAEARRIAHRWNQPTSWRPIVRRFSRQFRQACGIEEVLCIEETATTSEEL